MLRVGGDPLGGESCPSPLDPTFDALKDPDSGTPVACTQSLLTNARPVRAQCFWLLLSMEDNSPLYRFDGDDRLVSTKSAHHDVYDDIIDMTLSCLPWNQDIGLSSIDDHLLTTVAHKGSQRMCDKMGNVAMRLDSDPSRRACPSPLHGGQWHLTSSHHHHPGIDLTRPMRA